jgi:hypothetical protein
MLKNIKVNRKKRVFLVLLLVMEPLSVLTSNLLGIKAAQENQLIQQVKMAIAEFSAGNQLSYLGRLSLAFGIITDEFQNYVLVPSSNKSDATLSQIEDLLKQGVNFYITVLVQKNQTQVFIQSQGFISDSVFVAGQEKILYFHDHVFESKLSQILTHDLLKQAHQEIVAEIHNPKKQHAA